MWEKNIKLHSKPSKIMRNCYILCFLKKASVRSEMLQIDWTFGWKKIKWFAYILSNLLIKSSKRVGEIGFVVFGRSNIKNEIWILQYIPRKRVKYLARARALTSKFAQKFRGMLIWAYFLKISNFCTAVNFCRIETLVIWKSIYFWW